MCWKCTCLSYLFHNLFLNYIILDKFTFFFLEAVITFLVLNITLSSPRFIPYYHRNTSCPNYYLKTEWSCQNCVSELYKKRIVFCSETKNLSSTAHIHLTFTVNNKVPPFLIFSKKMFPPPQFITHLNEKLHIQDRTFHSWQYIGGINP